MITIKTDAKSLNYINRFASKEQTRYALQGIYFDPDGRALVATDGHRLGMLPHSWDMDYTTPGAPELTRGVTLQTKADKNIMAVIKKLQGTVTVEIPEEATDPTRGGSLTAKIYDYNGLSVTVAIMDATYPLYKNAIPDEHKQEKAPTEFIAFNPAYMADFAGYDKNDRLQLEFFGPEAPMIVRNSALPDFMGVLMPVRWDAVAKGNN